MSSPRSRAPSAPTLHADVSSPPTPHSLTSDWTPLVGEENAKPENLRRSDDDNEPHADRAEGFILGPMPVEVFLDSLPAKHTARRPPTQGAFDDVDEPSRLFAAIRDHDCCPGFKFKHNAPDLTLTKPALVGGCSAPSPAAPSPGSPSPRQAATGRTCVARATASGRGRSPWPLPCPSMNSSPAYFAAASSSDPITRAALCKLVEERRDLMTLYLADCLFDDLQKVDELISMFPCELRGCLDAISSRLPLRERTRRIGNNIHVSVSYYVIGMLPMHRCTNVGCTTSQVPIHGLRARLMRWDMSGLRFAHASTVERGYDPTVERASSGEECLFRQLVSCRVREQLDLKPVEVPEEKVKDEVREEYKARIPRPVALTICAEDGRLKRCLVSRPIATNFSMRWGVMRGYRAVMGGRVVFMEDTWRQYVHEPEGRILKELAAHRVKNIPHVEHDGDVPKVVYSDGTGRVGVVLPTGEARGTVRVLVEICARVLGRARIQPDGGAGIERRGVQWKFRQRMSITRPAALTICAEDGRFKCCFVSRPITTNFSMRRGGMRGYWAVMGSRVVFLEDTWWQYVHEPEGRILKELAAHRVKNIPHVEHGGDVPKVVYSDRMLTRFSAMANFERTTRSKTGQQPSFQCTEMDLYSTALPRSATSMSNSSVSSFSIPVHQDGLILLHRLAQKAKWLYYGGPRIVVHPRVHHHLNLKKVGFPLQTMRGTKELLNAMHDAFQALVAVHDKARRIHRDISAGYLIDSSKVQEDEQATDKYIVGTRMFLSQRLEAQSRRRQMLQDDMEALLYVVAYCGLHWLQHPAHSKDTRQAMMEPGKGKLDNKENQTYIDPPNFNVDLKDWLSHSMDLNHPRRPSEATQ
ncbi:hypothetical protein SCP_0706600 [Sparassis crispa]|uniref:Fungal-type protein kinase domain-containing protein n=1 Tax=Sparassis crispa TaxID=139825 RepID=A0A401GTG9_9APHY|nr:hypothetical protein SCP_0706600 [Sparassis crispa]GBE85473.1 hypothetical protein SCP_0706600 [Sparassis crispa]